MTLKLFANSGLQQATLASLLFTVFCLTPVLAVELVGTPTSAGNSAKSQTLQNDLPVAMDEAQDSMDDKQEPSPEVDAGDKSLEQVKHVMNHMGPALQSAMDQPAKASAGFSAALLIPIFGIVFIFGGPVVLVIVLAYLHYRDKARRAQNINVNIDKLLAAGRDIPVELLRGDETRNNKTDVYMNEGSTMVRDNVNLNKGIKNVCVGIGLLIFLTILCGIKIGAIGFIVIGVGASELLIWKLSGVKTTINKAQD